MTIQKIKGGRTNGIVADDFIGDKGSLFYNEDIGDLRLSDGVTKGGIPLTFNSTGTLRLAPATCDTIGGVVIGDGLKIDYSGTISVDLKPEHIPLATAASVGGVIVGDGLTVDSTGTVSANFSTMPMASSTVLGGIKVGEGFFVDANGFLSISNFVNTDGGGVSTNYGGVAPLDGGGI